MAQSFVVSLAADGDGGADNAQEDGGLQDAFRAFRQRRLVRRKEGERSVSFECGSSCGKRCRLWQRCGTLAAAVVCCRVCNDNSCEGRGRRRLTRQQKS